MISMDESKCNYTKKQRQGQSAVTVCYMRRIRTVIWANSATVFLGIAMAFFNQAC